MHVFIVKTGTDYDVTDTIETVTQGLEAAIVEARDHVPADGRELDREFDVDAIIDSLKNPLGSGNKSWSTCWDTDPGADADLAYVDIVRREVQ